MQTPHLLLRSVEGDKTIALNEGTTLFAGRTAECDLYLPSPAVSRRHAVFLVRGGLYGIKDLESANGTYLNGKRLSRPVRLRGGDVIQIGPYSLRFVIPQVPGYDAADRTAVLSPEEVKGMVAHRFDSAPAPDGDNDIVPAAMEKAKSPPPASKALPPTDHLPVEPPSAGRLSAVPPPASPAPEAGAAAGNAAPGLRPRVSAAPKKPRVMADDETGDGADDAGFMEKDEDAPEQDPELALARAAAEAGLMGEFAPDVPEPSPEDSARAGSGPAVADGAGEPFAPDAAGPVEFPPPPETGPGAIDVDAPFRSAIEARLYLYSFLDDMEKERRQLEADHPNPPDAVRAELERQEREMRKHPPADKAEAMIAKRLEKRRALKEAVAEAKKNGRPPPPRPSRLMLEAEEIAINQWTIIAQSARETLPAAIAEGYRLMADEPLTEILTGAGVDATTLMGGAAYYLGLEKLLEEARYNHTFLKAKLAGLNQPDDRKALGRNGLLGIFGRKNAAQPDEPEEDAAVPAELNEARERMARRIAGIEQELAFLEPLLVKEFWDVYALAAVHFLSRAEEIPTALRAFLRYGVISRKPWFLGDEAREHVMKDCAGDVVKKTVASGRITNILYADEYLAAVLAGECTPAMDENLEINARNSPEWKADKALRKLINCRSQTALLRELMDTLSETMRGLEEKSATAAQRLAALAPGSKNYKQVKGELEQQRQAFRVEIGKLGKLSEKIRLQTLAALKEQIDETERRFNSGELPRPEPEFLVRREVEAIRKIGRLLANLKERFLPLVMREFFLPGTDAANDRPSIRAELDEMERRDPAIFLENIVPSKKKRNRIDLRISPVVVLVPSAGILAFSWNPRQRPEDGRLAIPTCFIRRRVRERQLVSLLADFRWDTAKAAAGMDVMNSDTIVAAFMGVRWDWRKRSKEGREKGLVYMEQNDRTNWRRVYETYMESVYAGGKKLFNRNYDFYERIFAKYFDPPEGVEFFRK